ncbi:hypothetical protein GJ496_004050 [Pomphorhynchus laevis]|nr:hypothetical protein GJ496_004050 [Pomphorhynchus laevis]
MNTVRKALSKIKGGGLLRAAYPGKVLSLILSDIIGDPVDLIASAPTVQDNLQAQDAYAIIQKYDLTQSLSTNIIEHLRTRQPAKNKIPENYVKVVGSNIMALNAAANHLRTLGWHPVILSDSLTGEARKCGQLIGDFVGVINQNSDSVKASEILRQLQISKYEEKAKQVINSDKPLCLLLGGETTVTIKGSGIGGRNQELALAFSLKLKELGIDQDRCVMLAAGTDGIDGPTDAAGAIVLRQMIRTTITKWPERL